MSILDEAEWMLQAACLGEDTDRFFPAHKDFRAIRDVKSICRSCPVAQECLLHALNHNEEHGVWGGTTPGDRDVILYGRRRRHRDWV